MGGGERCPAGVRTSPLHPGAPPFVSSTRFPLHAASLLRSVTDECDPERGNLGNLGPVKSSTLARKCAPSHPGRIPRARLAGPRFPVSFSTHCPPDPARPEDGAAAQAEECAPAGPGPASWRGEGAPPGAALGPPRRQAGKRPAADRRSAGHTGRARIRLEVFDFFSMF